MKDRNISFKIYKLESIDENDITIIYESFLFRKKQMLQAYGYVKKQQQ